MKIIRTKLFGMKMGMALTAFTGDASHLVTSSANKQLEKIYNSNLSKFSQQQMPKMTPTSFIGN